VSVETFIEKFGSDDPVAAFNLRCEMVARAIRAIGDCTKHGECWLYPKTNADGYGITSVLHKTRVVSRLVQCLATGKPYDYHNEDGEYMIASHKTPVICRHRNCCNPEHLYWETLGEGCKRREDEVRAKALAAEVSSSLAPKALLSIA
jgi:hypothetical protein